VLDEVVQIDRRPVSHAASWIAARDAGKPQPRTMRAIDEMAAGDTILTGTPTPEPVPTCSANKEAGKSRLEALRPLKRHLARTVFQLLRQHPATPPMTIKVRGGKVRPPVLV
jgi:hypothetical protein